MAAVIPEPDNAVAVVLVPVIFVPVYQIAPGPTSPVAPLILPTYTHLAEAAAPPTVRRYVFMVLVFRYISPTWAFDTPEPENAVAVVEVPVIPVPEYHCALNPVCPLNEIWKVNILWIVILPLSMDTGISTTPPSVTVFAILIVIVGWVGSVSTEVVTPVGATMFELLTEAGT